MRRRRSKRATAEGAPDASPGGGATPARRRADEEVCTALTTSPVVMFVWRERWREENRKQK